MNGASDKRGHGAGRGAADVAGSGDPLSNLREKVKAIFVPLRTDDLKPEVVPFIGHVLMFEAVWIIDHECDYNGQWAMAPTRETFDLGFHVAWVPECDLDVIEKPTDPANRCVASLGDCRCYRTAGHTGKKHVCNDWGDVVF